MNTQEAPKASVGSRSRDISQMVENERRLETLALSGAPVDVPTAAAVVAANEMQRIRQDQQRLAGRLDPMRGAYASASA